MSEARIIYNPKAGIERAELTVRAALTRIPDAEIIVTKEADDAYRFAREAVTKEYKKIIVAGGDGTIHEVINGIAPHFSKVELGIVPLGTGNDLGRALQLPHDLDEAVAIINQGKKMTVDILKVQQGQEFIWCLNSIIAGLRTVEKGEWLGLFSYLQAAVHDIRELQSRQVTIRSKGKDIFTGEVYVIAFSNGSYAGAGLPIAPEAQVNDGLMDIVAIRAVPLSQLARLIPLLPVRRHLHHEAIFWTQVDEVFLTAEPTMSLSVDGELHTAQTPVTITLEQHPVTVYV